MLIIDAHLDLAWNVLRYNRDLLQKVPTLRVREKNMPGAGRGKIQSVFPIRGAGGWQLLWHRLCTRKSDGLPGE